MIEVVVVGGGAAGMAAADRLAEAGLAVALLERGPSVGGVAALHVDAPDEGGRSVAVDMGLFELAEPAREAMRLIEELGLDTRRAITDACFADAQGRFVWGTYAGVPIAGELVRDVGALAADLARFKHDAEEALIEPRYDGATLGAYVRDRGYGDEVRLLALHPRAAACFGLPDGDPDAVPVQSFVRALRGLGLLGPGTAERRVVVGGMHRYAAALSARLAQRGVDIRTGVRVERIERVVEGVLVRAVDEGGRELELRAQHAILAVPPAEAAPLLPDATPEEARRLAEVPHRMVHLVAHTDTALLPADRSRWASLQYSVGGPRPSLTVRPRALAGEEGPDVLVTVGPQRAIDPRTVLAERRLWHPVVDPDARRRSVAIAAIDGRAGVWLAGGWREEPWGHEEAIQSGLAAAGNVLAQASERGAERSRSSGVAHEVPFRVGERLFVMGEADAQLSCIARVEAIFGGRAALSVPAGSTDALVLRSTVYLVPRGDRSLGLVTAQLEEREGALLHVKVRSHASARAVDAPRPVTRRHLRAHVRLGCDLWLGAAKVAGAWIADLGAGGVEVVVPGLSDVSAGSEGRIELELPGEPRWTLALRVVRAKASAAAPLRLGCELLGVPPDVEESIDSFAQLVLRSRLTRAPV